MITRPVRERSIDVIGAMVQRGIEATGLRRSDCSACRAVIIPRLLR